MLNFKKKKKNYEQCISGTKIKHTIYIYIYIYIYICGDYLILLVHYQCYVYTIWHRLVTLGTICV